MLKRTTLVLTCLLTHQALAQVTNPLLDNRHTKYNQSIQLASAELKKDSLLAVPEAYSILLVHGQPTRRAVVLLHGITNSPKQWRPMAQSLYNQGYNVYVPRLPHHGEKGGSVRRLAKLNVADLVSVGNSSFAIGSGLGDSLVVIGLSAGGNIGAWMAQYKKVDQVILIAPAIALTRLPTWLREPLVGAVVLAPDISRKEKAAKAEDRNPGWTSRGIAQMLLLGQKVQRKSNQTAPLTRQVVLLLNEADRTINPTAARNLVHSWRHHGAFVSVYQIPQKFKLKHDIIDPRESQSDTTTIYPLVRQLIAHGSLPEWLKELDIKKQKTKI